MRIERTYNFAKNKWYYIYFLNPETISDNQQAWEQMNANSTYLNFSCPPAGQAGSYIYHLMRTTT